MESPDTESPALSTCSNADIFRRMNTMLGNALDFTGVCTTPNNTKGKPDMLCGKVSFNVFTLQVAAKSTKNKSLAWLN